MGSNINQRSTPNVQTSDRNQNQAQSNIITSVKKISSNPILQNNFLNQRTENGVVKQGVSIKTGSNSINHFLGRPLVGWQIYRKRSAANIYDDQDNNKHPDITLILVSDADVIVDVVVF